MEAVEQSLGKFLLEIKKLSAKEFREQYPHAFLLRTAEWREKLDEGELSANVKEKTERMHRMMGRAGMGAGYALGMLGASSVKQVAQEATAKFKRRKEQRLLRVKGIGSIGPGDRVSIGTKKTCSLQFVGDMAEGVSPEQASFVMGKDISEWFVLDDGSEWGTFVAGGRVEPGVPAPIVDAELIRLGSALEYRFFSPVGWFAYLKFHSKLARAKAELNRKAE